MLELGRMFPPPPSHPMYDLFEQRAKNIGEYDIGVRLRLKELQKKLPGFILTRVKGGTQFPISNLLREYFNDYAYRTHTHGLHSLPSSFNIIESFLSFSHDYVMFDLREEREHLLRMNDYIEWYTSGAFPEEPGVLTEILPSGVTFLYNMVAPTQDFRLETNNTELNIVGVAIVRHSTELSMVVLCGERPMPNCEESLPDDDVEKMVPWREMTAAVEFSKEDRYFKEFPGYSKTIALARFDLESRSFFVRSLQRDIGRNYLVYTDDPTAFPDHVSQDEKDKHLQNCSNTLVQYDCLFSSLLFLMYLPVYFISERDRVLDTTFSTELHASRNSIKVKRAISNIRPEPVFFSRAVRCLQGLANASVGNEITVIPDDFVIARKGFWKKLAPGQIGEDKTGNSIVGKTWVERTDAWATHGLEEFVIRKADERVDGPKPGHLYVMRSGSHSVNVYKIGKTQRTAETRARELSAVSGVPSGFETLASWEVGDVDLAEKEVHRRLNSYRINRRREFFKAPLSKIIKEIEVVIGELP